MERFHEELEAGRRHLRTADHLVSITFPLVKDNKLLLTAMENLFSGAKNLMASLLHYEEAFKRIPHFQGDYDTMAHWFRSKCVPYYNLSRDYGISLDELNVLADNHKTSAVEFTRGDGLVMFSDTCNFRKISLAELKAYIGIMKRMLLDVEGVVLRYEGIFGRSKGRVKAR